MKTEPRHAITSAHAKSLERAMRVYNQAINAMPPGPYREQAGKDITRLVELGISLAVWLSVGRRWWD